MKLKQVSVAIENSPGRLYEVTNALSEAGINLRALNLVDTGLFGQLRLLVSDIAKTRRILMEKNMPARIFDVVAVEVCDKRGEMAKILKVFMDAEISVISTYAFVGSSAGNAVLIFRFNDNDKAIKVLKQSGYNILDYDAFDMLDHEGVSE